MAGISTPQIGPERLRAFASWLRLCAISSCAEEDRCILEQWAAAKFFQRANDPNIAEAFSPAPGKRTPVFQSFEIYCLTYPKSASDKPLYKQVLRRMSHEQAPANAMAYAGCFFQTIAKAVRREFVAMENDAGRFAPLPQDASAEADESRFVDDAPLPGETMDAGDADRVESIADACLQALSQKHKLFLWADSQGMANSNAKLLALAGLQKSTAHHHLKEAAKLMQEKLAASLPEEFSGSLQDSHTIRACLAKFAEKLNLWALSEKLQPQDFF